MIAEIIIPSKNRKQKLVECINSILLNNIIDLKINIYLSLVEEYNYFCDLFHNIDEISINLLDTYKVPEFWNMCLNHMTSDIMVYINDDVLFYQNTLENIIKYYKLYFPNYDGLMGLNQSNLKSTTNVDAAFGIIGKNFKKYFRNGTVWCNDYHRFFADKELELYAKSINKFVYSRECEIIHQHPSINKNWEDETHLDVRKYLARDRETFKKRQALGLLWGKDYKLINQPEEK